MVGLIINLFSVIMLEVVNWVSLVSLVVTFILLSAKFGLAVIWT